MVMAHKVEECLSRPIASANYLLGIGNGAVALEQFFVSPLLNIEIGRLELVVRGLQLFLQQSIQLRLKFGSLRFADEVVLLIGIGLVVVQKPRAFEIANIGVPLGA